MANFKLQVISFPENHNTMAACHFSINVNLSLAMMQQTSNITSDFHKINSFYLKILFHKLKKYKFKKSEKVLYLAFYHLCLANGKAPMFIAKTEDLYI